MARFITLVMVGYIGTIISGAAFVVVLLLCLTDHVGLGAVEGFGALLLAFVGLLVACIFVAARGIALFRDR